MGPVREYLREVGVHARGEFLLLLPALAGEVPGAVAHRREEAVEATLVVLTLLREVALLFLRGEDFVQAGVHVALPGITCAMAAIVADIEGFVTLRSRSQGRRPCRTEVVGSVQEFRMELELTDGVRLLRSGVQGARQHQQGGQDDGFSHVCLSF